MINYSNYLKQVEINYSKTVTQRFRIEIKKILNNL